MNYLIKNLNQNAVKKWLNYGGSRKLAISDIADLSHKDLDQNTVLRLVNATNENGEYLYQFGAIKLLARLQKIKPDSDIERVLSDVAGSDYKTAKFDFKKNIDGDDKHGVLVDVNNDYLYKFDLETGNLVSIGLKDIELVYNLETGTTIGIKNNVTRETAVSGEQTPTKREVYIKKSTGEELTEIMQESQIKGEYEIYQIGSDGKKYKIGLCEYDGNGGRHIEKNLTSLDGTKTDYVYADDAQGNRFLHYQITSSEGKTLFKTTKKHKVISDTHYQTFEDGKGYDIEIFDDKVVVTKLVSNGRKTSKLTKASYATNWQKTSEFIERKIIDLSEDDLNKLKFADGRASYVNKIASKYNGKWIDRQLLPALKQLSGSEWFALDKNTPHLLGTGAEPNNAFSLAMDNGKIKIDGLIVMSPETKPHLGVFEHELGHQKFHNLDLFKDKELIEIYSREKELFTSSFPNEHITSIDYFLAGNDFQSEISTGGMNETTAETNLLLNIPQSWDLIQDRTVILQQYFPNTIAKIGELLRKHETL